MMTRAAVLCAVALLVGCEGAGEQKLSTREWTAQQLAIDAYQEYAAQVGGGHALTVDVNLAEPLHAFTGDVPRPAAPTHLVPQERVLVGSERGVESRLEPEFHAYGQDGYPEGRAVVEELAELPRPDKVGRLQVTVTLDGVTRQHEALILYYENQEATLFDRTLIGVAQYMHPKAREGASGASAMNVSAQASYNNDSLQQRCFHTADQCLDTVRTLSVRVEYNSSAYTTLLLRQQLVCNTKTAADGRKFCGVTGFTNNLTTAYTTGSTSRYGGGVINKMTSLGFSVAQLKNLCPACLSGNDDVVGVEALTSGEVSLSTTKDKLVTGKFSFDANGNASTGETTQMVGTPSGSAKLDLKWDRSYYTVHPAGYLNGIDVSDDSLFGCAGTPSPWPAGATIPASAPECANYGYSSSPTPSPSPSPSPSAVPNPPAEAL